MRIGFVGCGYVFDHYMATMRRHESISIAGVADRDEERLRRATDFYGLQAYPSTEALLADDSIDIVVNLTSIESHYDVTRAALLAGRHVYSEKPFTVDLGQARELVDLAERLGLRVSAAPSNALSATSQTMWKAVQDGVVGDVRLVYAEFDDNPVYLMSPEGWRSRSGAPWPYIHEYEMGCTWEHVGYHLAWMCAIFGPVRSVTAFSKLVSPDKVAPPNDTPSTPDFSVACLDFASGVVGRVTCSISAPFDHRMRIIGNRGVLHADTYRHYECPVYFEKFSKLTLNARKSYSVRTRTPLQRLLGVNGRRVPLVMAPPPGSSRYHRLLAGGRGPKALVRRLMRGETGQQDKAIGIAELADAISTGRAHFPSHEFILHVTELTLAIQSAGPNGASRRLETTFTPLPLPSATKDAGIDYKRYAREGRTSRLAGRILDRWHRH